MRVVHLVLARRTDDTGQVLLQRTEEELEKWKHPDPYIPPTAPGGSKYERNIPAPILERMLPWLRIILNGANGRVLQLLRVLRLTSRLDMEIGIKRAWKCIYHLSI
jgi:hypothetical protein